MIEQAALSLARKGLQRTSFAEVLEASGAPRGSLYHHFPGGKDELILAALDAAGAYALHGLEGSADRSAVEVATAFLDLWRGVLLRSHFDAGCAVAAVAVAAEAPDLLARAGKVFAAWRERLTALLTRSDLDKTRARALANLLIAASEGAVLLARAQQSMAPFEEVAEMLLRLVANPAYLGLGSA
jgi:AcrR family transcriptional regulator